MDMKLLLKKLLVKILITIQQPSVIAVNFSQTLTSKETGDKTASATISVPSGYAVVSNCRPISPYISGNASTVITDRGVVTMNGNTASFSYYLYNPNSFTGNLVLEASILCYKVA
jgi:hypothetical protein